jgi:hypothetical protein
MTKYKVLSIVSFLTFILSVALFYNTYNIAIGLSLLVSTIIFLRLYIKGKKM